MHGSAYAYGTKTQHGKNTELGPKLPFKVTPSKPVSHAASTSSSPPYPPLTRARAMMEVAQSVSTLLPSSHILSYIDISNVMHLPASHYYCIPHSAVPPPPHFLVDSTTAPTILPVSHSPPSSSPLDPPCPYNLRYRTSVGFSLPLPGLGLTPPISSTRRSRDHKYFLSHAIL